MKSAVERSSMRRIVCLPTLCPGKCRRAWSVCAERGVGKKFNTSLRRAPGWCMGCPDRDSTSDFWWQHPSGWTGSLVLILHSALPVCVWGVQIEIAPLAVGGSIPRDGREHWFASYTHLSLIAPRPFLSHTLATASAGGRNLVRGWLIRL